jgi:hypothetical protein
MSEPQGSSEAGRDKPASADESKPDKPSQTLEADAFWFTAFFVLVFFVPFLSLLFTQVLGVFAPRAWFGFLLLVTLLLVLWLLFFRDFKDFKGKAAKVIKQLFVFDCFGWIVLLSGELLVWVSLIPEVVKDSTGVFRVLYGYNQDVSTAPLAETLNYLSLGTEVYSDFMSSPQTLRILLIGLVVLFISKMYGTHQELVTETEEVRQQIGKVRSELPEVNNSLFVSRNLFETASNLFQMRPDHRTLPKDLLKAVENDAGLSGQLTGLTGKLRFYVENTYSGLLPPKSKDIDYDFHLHTYLAMLSKYLEMEKLSFKESPSQFDCVYEYKTWFVFYALVVRATVEALPCRWRNCQFYTILPRRPSQFFNILNSGTPLEWSTGFLEEFNRVFIRSNAIEYYRYFLTVQSDRFQDSIIPTWSSFRTDRDYSMVFVEKKEGEVVRCLIVEDEDDIVRESLNKINKACASALWNGQLQPFPQVTQMQPFPKVTQSGKRYLIVDRQNLDDIKKQHPALDSFFARIGEAMTPYHKSKEHFKTLALHDKGYHGLYQSRQDTPIPKDLFAVREDGTWKYCIGAFQEGGTSDTVTIKVYRPDCKLWPQINEALDLLFIKPAGEVYNIA